MQKLCLNGEWDLVERPLADGPAAFASVAATDRTRCIRVPGDVNDCLVRSGEWPEPLVGLNYEKFDWVADRSWWFRKRFTVPETWRAMPSVELSLDGLDVHADVWCNGKYVGHHASSFRPFIADLTDRVAYGAENTVWVRLTTGRERVPQDPQARDLMHHVPTEADRGYPDRGFPGRIYLRKPAYVWGWDWCPPLPTCGITGDVCVCAYDKLEISEVKLRSALRQDGSACVEVLVELHLRSTHETRWGQVKVACEDENGRIYNVQREGVLIQSGLTHVPLSLSIPTPRLWWPNGAGTPHRYAVSAEVMADDLPPARKSLKYGIRTIEMRAEPGRFSFSINGKVLFLKGGNWVPPDSLYGRIADERIHALVGEAATANFNCLRVWGGGHYPREAFFDACDEYGILVWQDFMSACAMLPGDERWFRQEFLAEAEYQIRRLHNRACLLLWCGNNEVAQMVEIWGQKDPGWRIYFEDLPGMVRLYANHIPYWPTSPYGGQDTVHDPNTGDSHHWVVMRPEPEFWSSPEYWDKSDIPVFVSEYGYGGPCCPETVMDYLGEETANLFCAVAEEHTNAFYDNARVRHSIQQQYKPSGDISDRDFLLLGGLCQGLNLGYSLESLRANNASYGGLHWMFNDAWGENGWSIIDYYLRRKIAFYNVARCLAPCRLVFRRGGTAFGGDADSVVLIALNDRVQPLDVSVQFGFMSYDGEAHSLNPIRVNLLPFQKALIAQVPVPDPAQCACGTLVAIPESQATLMPVSWRHSAFAKAGIPAAKPVIMQSRVIGDDLQVTTFSSTFAHAVHLNVPNEMKLSDHYFDLLAGEQRTITIFKGAALHALEAHSVNQPQAESPVTG